MDGDGAQQVRLPRPVAATCRCKPSGRAVFPDERPLRFRLDGHEYLVEEVVDQWYGPEHAFFKLRVDDGNLYILRMRPRCLTGIGSWCRLEKNKMPSRGGEGGGRNEEALARTRGLRLGWLTGDG